MRINYQKLNEAGVEIVNNNGVAAAVLPEENGFRKLIAYLSLSSGEYAWVHSAFRKREKKSRRKQ